MMKVAKMEITQEKIKMALDELRDVEALFPNATEILQELLSRKENAYWSSKNIQQRREQKCPDAHTDPA